MKHILGALALFCAACGPPAETVRPVAAPVPKPVSNPEEEIRSRLSTLTALLERKDLTREDRARAHTLTKDLAHVVWSGRESVLAALRIAPDVVDHRPALESLELALLQKPDPGGWTSEVRDGRLIGRRERDVYFLDRDTSVDVARLAVKEEDERLRNLALVVLRSHSELPTGKKVLPLSADLIDDLLGLWDRVGSFKGRMGTSSRDLLVRVVGPYQGSNPRVRSFLERIIRDAQGDHALRTTALDQYRWGASASDRLSMAESLFRVEQDAAIRREAVDLVSLDFQDAPGPEIEPKAFELLARVACEDGSGDVRGAAGRSLLQFPGRKALEATTKLLEAEKDPSVRAGILGGFRWGTFFKDNREELHGAQDLAAKHFLKDPDDEVQREAIEAYLDLIWRTLLIHDDSGTSLDPRAIKSIRSMVERIQSKPLSRGTKAFIREKLEKDFEKRIPELAASGDYAELKRYLEK